MKHHSARRKFGRERSQRTALMRSLLRALILHDKIQTTEAKAKEIRPAVEKLVTRAKDDTLANRRVILSRLGNEEHVVKRLFDTIAPRYKERSGGYTRIVRMGHGQSDARSYAVISFV